MARILEVGLRWAGSWARLAAAFFACIGSVHAACTTAPKTVLIERYLSAACEACWQSNEPSLPGALVLDWIVPASVDAPLSAAALPEAATRAPGLGVSRPLLRQRLLPRTTPVQLRVADGPAVNGYIGLRLDVSRHRRLARPLVAYMALIEQLPAGSEGSTVARQLVRALIGPIVLDELDVRASTMHLRAVRVPTTARPERLSAAAWVETTEGELVAAAEARRCGAR